MKFTNIIILLILSIIVLTDCSDVIYDNNCKAQCSAISKPGQVPSFNGCGSYLVKIDFSKYDGLSDFNTCCNKHDICYNTCSKNKNSCDFDFGSCLGSAIWSSNSSYLTKMKNAAIALSMVTAVETFGCPAYKSAFSRTCQCP